MKAKQTSDTGSELTNLETLGSLTRWTGLCIEGSPTMFAMLETNRPRCNTRNRIIGRELVGRHKKFYTFTKVCLANYKKKRVISL